MHSLDAGEGAEHLHQHSHCELEEADELEHAGESQSRVGRRNWTEEGRQQTREDEEQRERIDVLAQPLGGAHVREVGPATRLQKLPFKITAQTCTLSVGPDHREAGQRDSEERVDGRATEGVVAQRVDDSGARESGETPGCQKQNREEESESGEDPEREEGVGDRVQEKLGEPARTYLPERA